MSIFDSKPALRWAAPLAFVAVVGGTTGVLATATAKDKLPEISAQELLVKVQQSKVDTFSGTVIQKSNLGLPDLPGVGGSDDASLTSLISGTHTMDVWYDGPDKARLRVQGTNDETDVVTNGRSVWQWSYKDKTAKHITLSEPSSKHSGDRKAPADLPKTPQEAAKLVLDNLSPTTEVTTAGTAEVAGEAAYELVLTPKDSGSLVTQVRLAVDGDNFMPLRVQVIAGADKPAFEVAYDSVDFDAPDPAQFEFKPPPGTDVTEVKPEQDSSKADKQHSDKNSDKAHEGRPDGTTVVGQGWSSVLVTKVPSTDEAGELQGVLEALPKVSGSWGSGRLLQGTAFSAVLTDDGRMAVGSVKPEVLYDALAK